LNIFDLIWRPPVVEKLIRKHRLLPQEVEQVFRGNPHFRFIESGDVRGADLYAALGRTDSGRYVIAFFVRKRDGSALIISARDMDAKERRAYAKK